MSKKMLDMVFPNNDGGPQMMLVVVGPEGGWEESYELDMFKWMELQKVLLGLKVLCSNVAIFSFLALANKACASDSVPL